MFSRALVTGGAGFIGSTLVDRLIDDGVSVLVVDDLSHGKLSRLARARETHHMVFHQMDIRAPQLVDVAQQFAPEIVFHLAAQIDAVASVSNPINDAEANIVGTVSVLVSALASGAEDVLIYSWNEYFEGSTIEPTEEYGTRYVELTRRVLEEGARRA